MEAKTEGDHSTLHWETASTSRMNFWAKWIKHRIRQCMILEVILVVILILLLKNSYKIISQNETNRELISHLQNRIEKIEMHLGLNFTANTSDKKTIEEDTDLSEKHMSELIDDVVTTSNPSFLGNPAEFEEESKSVETFQELQNSSDIPIKVPHYNAASYLSGAYIGYDSSEQVNYSIFPIQQRDYVILERELVPNKAWCTESSDPDLYINLVSSIRPIAVSYQHLRWNGTVPDGAPLEYDVLAYFSSRTIYEIPLALNCKYDSSGPQEQKCLVSYPDYLRDVYRITIRIRKNHGNTNVTCAYLFRVFGNGTNPKEPIKPSKETCSSLIWYRKNYSFIYNYILEKNCKIWYNNDCCDECPECCTECETQDFNYGTILFLMLIFGIIFLLFSMCYLGDKERRKREETGYIQ